MILSSNFLVFEKLCFFDSPGIGPNFPSSTSDFPNSFLSHSTDPEFFKVSILNLECLDGTFFVTWPDELTILFHALADGSPNFGFVGRFFVTSISFRAIESLNREVDLIVFFSNLLLALEMDMLINQ